MKIAIDIRTAGGEKAGKGWYTFHIVQNLLKLEALKSAGDQNDYVLYSKEGIPGFEQFKNARLRLISGRGLFWHSKVARDIRKEQIDIFFAPSSYIIPALLPKNIKTVLTVHDLVAFLFPDTHNKKATLIERLFLKKAIKKAAVIVPVSENTGRDLRKRFAIPPEKIKVIHAAAGEDFKPLRSTGQSQAQNSLKNFATKTKLPSNFFLAVGTLEPRKNYITLIKAFANIRKNNPGYHLVIVGREGWDFEPVYAAIRENYLNKYVHILGYLSGKSLVNLYNLARALVFPSFYEGFGIPPLEAMKCGCPVIASHSSSIPEVVGNSALLINPESVTDLAAAMQKLISNESLREQLSSKGPVQAKKFSWEISAGKLLEIMEGILS